jgi:hypothetical protein
MKIADKARSLTRKMQPLVVHKSSQKKAVKPVKKIIKTKPSASQNKKKSFVSNLKKVKKLKTVPIKRKLSSSKK